ncbi:MAG: hypothetical protein A3G87_06585 [Omnitrophica bacterium RIFCSPLOWO2_12_FULL_50_11]|nr:MAG: hypothetical protein A3G87_06585 [Omnitrophica bacterium RIFCSPLOWO2_12_FULL_50_11]
MRKSVAPTEKTSGRLRELIQRFAKVKILIIGDFILDEFVWGSVERISPEAPVPVVNVERESFVPGGALNVANNIRTLGGCVIPCGVVGRDLRGRMLVKAMRREGIDTRGVIYDETRPTTLKTRVVAHSQQVVRFDREQTRDLDELHIRQVSDFAKKVMPTVDVIVIEDYGKGVINPGLLKRVLREARNLRKPIVVDPKEKHFSFYRGVTALTPNRAEALSAFGVTSNGRVPEIDELGRVLLERLSVEVVLITLGEHGMILFERSGRRTRIPTAAHEVYDVSGAGDTVAAVFAMALAAGADNREAAILANKAAGIVVGKLGTAVVRKEELEASVDSKLTASQKRALAFV